MADDTLSPADEELAQLERIAAIPYTPLPDETIAALRNTFGNEGLGKYRPEYADQARRLCAITGATDTQLALFFGVCDRTILYWCAHFPAFREARKMGKDVADDRVEAAYYQRAVGYERKVRKPVVFQGRVMDEYEEIEHYPADPKAAFNWLKNRRPEEWKDRREIVDPTRKDDDNAPRRSKVELARHIVYALQRGADETALLPAPGGQRGDIQSITEKITITEED